MANTEDSQTVALNEIGHLLGPDHSEDENAIIWSSIPYGSLKRFEFNRYSRRQNSLWP